VSWTKKLNQPLDDGLSRLVATSGETLTIHGAPLERFKVAQLGKAAAVIPIKVQKEVFGLLVVVRVAEKPFTESEAHFLEAIADYASISLVNARLFRALEQAAEVARQGERRQDELRQALRKAVMESVNTAIYPLELVLKEQAGPLTEEQKRALRLVESSLRKLLPLFEQTIPKSEALPETNSSL
ncbi:MAG: GAF domain-containing protein, partial [Anaerolineales bacterium]